MDKAAVMAPADAPENAPSRTWCGGAAGSPDALAAYQASSANVMKSTTPPV